MKALVTGGGGFIGSHLSDALLEAGHEVRILDRAPARVTPAADTVVADLNDPGVVDDIVQGVDAVFHHAARVGLGVDFSDAPNYVSDNDLATARLLAALAHSRFDGRLVLASSMVVYGEGRYRCSVHGQVEPTPRRVRDLEAGHFDPSCSHCGRSLRWAVVDEDAPIRPRSVYAASKAAQEHLCSLWAAETGGSVVALRYHNVYGPRLPLDTPYAGVAALFRSALRRGDAPRVYEDGQQTRDFIHVSDVVATNLAALDLPMVPGQSEAVNVCSGRPVTIAEVATALSEAFGPNGVRPVITGAWRAGDVRHVVASPAKAEHLFGFKAKVDFVAGLAELAAETDPTS